MSPERHYGQNAEISNITAAKTVADVIQTCLGPKSMLKMILDPMGGIVWVLALRKLSPRTTLKLKFATLQPHK
ncbi:hypothetical protein BC827DRAFT_1266867 [Russula dissimulans]|nr:hypothetical protein BC827DRAFT_1266867 [Russula dissimulans]